MISLTKQKRVFVSVYVNILQFQQHLTQDTPTLYLKVRVHQSKLITSLVVDGEQSESIEMTLLVV